MNTVTIETFARQVMGIETRKYALVGAACVGKTTVVDAAEARFPNSGIIFVREAGTAYLSEHPEALQDVFSFPTQRILQEMTLQKELLAHAQNPHLILAERSVVDSVVHLLVRGDQEGADDLLERVLPWLPTYTCFLHLDVNGVPYLLNTVRTEDAALRSAINEMFGEFFVRYPGLPYRLIRGSEAERIRQVEKTLGVI